MVRAIQTNCYLVYCDTASIGAIIDPGDISEALLERIQELKLKIKYIINTHAHIDHIEGNDWFRKAVRAPVLVHYNDWPLYENPHKNMSVMSPRVVSVPKADISLKGGEQLHLGKISFEVVHTPGHTGGSICLMGEGILFTGDTLFAGSIGRVDLPGGSHEVMMSTLKNKIIPLDDNLIVLPGHGPSSTLKKEKAANPFLVRAIRTLKSDSSVS